MTTSRNIVVAGAGIGGLTAALALAARGFRVTVLEQAARLEEAGAGIQLSPNATRILIELGLGELLKPVVVVPEALVVRSARNGRTIVRMPLGETAAARFGAPYWLVHRADLYAALVKAARANPDIDLMLRTRVEDFAAHPYGLTILARRGTDIVEEYGIALIGADGLWSTLRERLDDRYRPVFRKRTAWRALVPAGNVPHWLREPTVQLWLGRNTHLVHYPVLGGAAINFVAIARRFHEEAGWSGEGSRRDLLKRFPRWMWSRYARAILKIPEAWQTWSLYDMPPLRRWGEGPMTLLGDAAHPMLPFLAQGAAMAIEDAAVLANHLAQSPRDIPAGMRAYETARRSRTNRVQRAARRNGGLYHRSGAEAFIRNIGMRALGGERLIDRYAWIYNWRPGEHAVEPIAEVPAASGEPDETTADVHPVTPRATSN